MIYGTFVPLLVVGFGCLSLAGNVQAEEDTAFNFDGTSYCAQQVSKGDRDKGLSAFPDVSCIDGGLGCFPTDTDEHCRFCKKSADVPSEFNLCVDSNAYCASQVSKGDREAKLSAFTDASCIDGGLGCFPTDTDVYCRFCKASTDVPSAYAVCGEETPPPPPPPATTKPEATPTPTPTPEPTTEAPKPTEPKPTEPAGRYCAAQVSKGDSSKGLSAFADASCAEAGGLGCFPTDTDVYCRFCKKSADVSSEYAVCSKETPPPPPPPATTEPEEREEPVGTKKPTPEPTLEPTPEPTVEPTPEPTTTTAAPPAIDAIVFPDLYCARHVSVEDNALGLSAVSDFPNCRLGGDGCFDTDYQLNYCRLCKTKAEILSSYKMCVPPSEEKETNENATTPAPVVSPPPVSPTPNATIQAQPINANDSYCALQVSVGDKEKGLSARFDKICVEDPSVDSLGCIQQCRLCRVNRTSESPYYTCETLQQRAAPIPFNAQPDETLSCKQKLSKEAKKSGFDVVEDEEECKTNEALLCMDYKCRFCKKFLTVVSSYYPDCKAPMNACESKVSPGDRAAGISAFSDSQCLEKSVTGCVSTDSPCRYCSEFESDLNTHLVRCSDVDV